MSKEYSIEPQYDLNQYSNSYQDSILGYSNHLEDYSSTIEHDHYPDLPNTQSVAPTSPPTSMSNLGGNLPHNKTKRSMARTASPHNSTGSVASSRRKRTKAGKLEKAKTPKLTQPLSVLTKDLTGTPVRDMSQWVNRPIEDRHKETEKRNGYVTRPMNSFMLYRSAYAERTKRWCAHNNHQVVSAVSGESWPLEPSEVREYYNELARIERLNHQKAHPTYKFSPNKPGISRKRKGAFDSDVESEPSEPDDAEWRATHRVRSHARSSREANHPSFMASNQVGHDMIQFNTSDAYNPVQWAINDDFRPRPIVEGHQDMYPDLRQYYTNSFPPNFTETVGNDLNFHPWDVMDYPSSSAFIGLPGASHHELLELQSRNTTPVPVEARIDPLLIPYEGTSQSLLSNGMGHGFSVGADLTSSLEKGSQFDLFYDRESNHGPAYSPPQPIQPDPWKQQEQNHHQQTYQNFGYWPPESSGHGFEPTSEFESFWNDMTLHQSRKGETLGRERVDLKAEDEAATQGRRKSSNSKNSKET